MLNIYGDRNEGFITGYRSYFIIRSNEEYPLFKDGSKISDTSDFDYQLFGDDSDTGHLHRDVFPDELLITCDSGLYILFWKPETFAFASLLIHEERNDD